MASIKALSRRLDRMKEKLRRLQARVTALEQRLLLRERVVRR